MPLAAWAAVPVVDDNSGYNNSGGSYPSTGYGASGAYAGGGVSAPVSAQGELFNQLQQMQEQIARQQGVIEVLQNDISRMKQESLERYQDLDRRIGTGVAPAATPENSSSGGNLNAPGAAADGSIRQLAQLTLVELYLERAADAWRALQLQEQAAPTRLRLVGKVGFDPNAMRRSLDTSYRSAAYDFINTLHVSPSKSVLAGSLTLALLVLPTIIRASEEAIRAVPKTYREAALSLGASKWRMVATVVLPAALPGILTSIVLSMGRAAGETAPIIFTAAVSVGHALHPGQVFTNPTPALPWNIYNLATEHEAAEQIRHVQFGMVLTLVALVLVLNTTAIVLRARIAKKLKG